MMIKNKSILKVLALIFILTFSIISTAISIIKNDYAHLPANIITDIFAILIIIAVVYFKVEKKSKKTSLENK